LSCSPYDSCWSTRLPALTQQRCGYSASAGSCSSPGSCSAPGFVTGAETGASEPEPIPLRRTTCRTPVVTAWQGTFLRPDPAGGRLSMPRCSRVRAVDLRGSHRVAGRMWPRRRPGSTPSAVSVMASTLVVRTDSGTGNALRDMSRAQHREWVSCPRIARELRVPSRGNDLHHRPCGIGRCLEARVSGASG